MDLDKVREFYGTLENEKIEQLALEEAGGLEPAVLPILKAEIEKRSLPLNLIEAIDVQTKTISEDELKTYVSRIVNMRCPECGKNDSELEGSIIRSVTSFVLMTTYKKSHVLSCNDCRNSLRKSAISKTILLGWWGIPWGIFRTPHALIMSTFENNKRESISKEVINTFIENNIGLIKANWDSEYELVRIIQAHNNN